MAGQGLSDNNRRAALSLNDVFDLWGHIEQSNEAARAEVLASALAVTASSSA
jgi:hypothetical protein